VQVLKIIHDSNSISGGGSYYCRGAQIGVGGAENLSPLPPHFNHCLEKRSVQSLYFNINRFFMKLFRTSSIVTVRDCQSLFGVDLPSIVLAKRFDKFIARYGNTPFKDNCML